MLDLWPNVDHGWLSPWQVAEVLPILAHRLSKIFPERADVIVANLPKAVKRARAMQTAWSRAGRILARRGVILQHAAWQPLFARLHVPIRATLDRHHHSEPSPRQLETAWLALRRHPETVLIGDRHHARRTMDWLRSRAPDTVRSIELDPLSNCGDSWLQLMERNLSTITALETPEQ